MTLIVDEKRKRAYPTLLADELMLKAVSHPLRIRILELLAHKSLYLSEIARTLNTNEQKVFYHLNLLKKAGLVVEDKSKSHAGLKYFKTVKKGLAYIPPYVNSSLVDIKLSDFIPVHPLLEGFITDGRITCKIVVGAPFPHGMWNKGSRSNYLVAEVASVLGRYGISKDRLAYLDVELDESDKKDNLIVIAGMHVNTIQEELNPHLPIRFDKYGTKIISEISRNEYNDDDCGFVVLADNPFDPERKVLVLAGIESVGTKAAVFAFKNHIDKIWKGNMYDREMKARVVRGVESKGEIREVVFLE